MNWQMSEAKTDYKMDVCWIKPMKVKVKLKLLSSVRLFATPWTVACQASLLLGFSRQEYWSRLPFPSPGDLPHPGIKPGSPVLQADALPSKPPGIHYLRDEFMTMRCSQRCTICTLVHYFSQWWGKGQNWLVNLQPEGLPRWLSGKESTCQFRRHRRYGSIAELERSPGGGNSNALQYSCLENPMDRGV